MIYFISHSLIFLLTRPLRDVTGITHDHGTGRRFLLTRPLRDVTAVRPLSPKTAPISTHTPLAGRDNAPDQLIRNRPISTHTPLAGRDHVMRSRWRLPGISTHTPLAGRDNFKYAISDTFRISTHTPLAGRDGTYEEAKAYAEENFYSHAPCGT